MRIIKKFKLGTLDDASVGDLVKLTYGNYQTDLAIVLALSDTHALYIALKTTSDAGYAPYADTCPKEHDCLNYGSGWVIEPIEAFEMSDNSGDIGSIAFTPDGDILCLGIKKQTHGIQHRYVDLEQMKIYSRTPQNGYIVREWRLWLNEEQRIDPDAEPLVTCKAYPQPPRQV